MLYRNADILSSSETPINKSIKGEKSFPIKNILIKNILIIAKIIPKIDFHKKTISNLP